MKKTMNLILAVSAAGVSMMLTACGGGGSDTSAPPVFYPYETVTRAECKTMEPKPGCTFNRDGSRIKVSQDPDFNRYDGGTSGSTAMWYVKVDAFGNAYIYDPLYSTILPDSIADISDFAGWQGGNMIGVGTTGLFHHDTTNGTYWLGKNGVLYNANAGEFGFGEAINNKNNAHSGADDLNWSSVSNESAEAGFKAGAESLQKQVKGLEYRAAYTIASSVMSAFQNTEARGFTTAGEMNNAFQKAFGVTQDSAMKALKQAADKDLSGFQSIKDRTAEHLGIKPQQAEETLLVLYGNAMKQYGINPDDYRQ